MKRFLMLLVSVAFLTSPVLAQAQESGDQDFSSILVPSGAWLVGPTTLIDGTAVEGGVPCVMVNKFSNDMELRLSGGGEEILALALNVGSASFAVDQSYLINIVFEKEQPIALPAQAFSEDTVVVGTEPGKEIYNFLKEKEIMTIRLGDSVMEFSLLGVPQGLKRLEDCFAPQPSANADAETVAAAQPVVPVATAPVANAPVTNAQDTEAAPALDEVSAQKVNELMDEIKGKTAPVAADAAASALPPAQPVISRADDVPVEMPTALTTAPAVVKPQDILTRGTATAVTGEGQQMRWRVMKGANLQNILEVWATSAQARLIWKSDQTFSVPESLALQGTFEAAVEAVLAQFPVGTARPVGKIYQDTQTQQKVLVIEMVNQDAPAPGTGNYAPIVSPR